MLSCSGRAAGHWTFHRSIGVGEALFLRREKSETMAHFHSLKVSDIRKETPQCVSVAFHVPEDLKETFQFEHGQYITLKMEVNGEELRRSYSICSSPCEEELRVAVKKVTDGRVSTKVVDGLRVGDVLEVMSPMGNFTTKLDPSNKKHYVAFAAGSGITPIISIIKTVLRKEPDGQCSLFYGNTDSQNIIFKEQLEQLKEKYGERMNLRHILSRESSEDELFSGRIDAEKATTLVRKFVEDHDQNEYFICGPEAMMLNVSGALETLGVDKGRVHIELFTTPVASNEAKDTVSAPVAEGMSRVTIIMDGEEQTIDLSTTGDAILDAALEAGMDVPFACKGAVCCTCKAKVIQGEARMEMNYALGDDEVEEGYVLTCQTHPVSPELVVDYDV